MMRQSYAIVWSGWQGDVLPGNGRLTTNFPVAKSPDGGSIKRWITAEFVFQKPSFSVPLSFDRESLDVKPYPAVEESVSKARLYRRAGTHDARELIPNDQWSFGRCADGKNKTPSKTDICFPAGFSPNTIYELVYEARDPTVMGLGFATTRDLISYLRYNGSAENPLFDSQENKPPREDELCYLNGQYIPFAKTKEEREKSGDPRLSIEKRYKDQADYVQQISRAARTLVDERFLLPEDAERLIGEAKKLPLFAERKSQ